MLSRVKPCPHCRRKVRLSHKSETVAENAEFRMKNEESILYRLQTQLVTVLCLCPGSVEVEVWLVELIADVALDTLSDDV